MKYRRPRRRLPVRAASLLVLLVLAAGCAGSREGDEDRPRRRAAAVDPADMGPHLDLAPLSGEVRTIQLYRAGDERSLPILNLAGGDPLTLEFDLLTGVGRPLSVYFYHADREWRRDLSPIQYLDGFSTAELLDYTSSRLANVPYTHYEYRFPNDDLRFLISGNYILRVTEQDDEGRALFEQPFVVTEQSMPVTLGLTNANRPGLPFPAVAPVAQFAPAGSDAASTFNYSVCFVRGGRLDRARCMEDPSLAVPPNLRFELDRASAFDPGDEDYYLDLSNLRTGPRVVGVDLSVVPYRVELEPDYARFPGTSFSEALGGRPIIEGGLGVGRPDVEGDYAEVLFSFVPPDERPFSSPLYLIGAFNEWRMDPDYALTWVAARGRYEGTALLKQGLYEYSYATRDRRLRQAFRAAAPPGADTYAAYVYFRDVMEGTDRLLTVAMRRP